MMPPKAMLCTRRAAGIARDFLAEQGKSTGVLLMKDPHERNCEDGVPDLCGVAL